MGVGMARSSGEATGAEIEDLGSMFVFWLGSVTEYGAGEDIGGPRGWEYSSRL
jgi:hypothetical protein